ncbi:DNA processing protein [Virgibacillus subterraneus]|uniref:DNA processing protein n=2 Tax=Virgibacillus TaxID=84406 RepID=A0A1H1CA86_9BACI|nr:MULTISPECIES: DNA-processing protein DprA [Virgibacillus]SDQ60990.1 DNA processing protein [Virgibacillus salinus]SEQ58777.1 DNA processing protein [Virgibacillus subterraneus]
MELVRKRLIHLHRCRGITRKTIRNFFRYDPTLKSIYTLTSTQFTQFFSLPHKNAVLFHSDLRSQELKNQLKSDLKSYKVITVVDGNYPFVLKTIKDAPLVLYAIGDTDLLHQNPILSVIGTRKPSREAKLKMEKYVLPLIQRNWVIVSGMATGIDSFAHQMALQNNGKTIAVLGSGFNHIYPKENTVLFKQIAKYGLLLSEYTPNSPPERFYFPERNRIISGLSFGTLVIEATNKSGTLITVDQALDQGREVYAVPGSPLLEQTKGCHKMIQDGAKLVLDPGDILEDWDRIMPNWVI